jgi:hypothetical protein
MPEAQDTEERPCLHCMMVELIEEFFAENPATSGEPDTIDTDEVIIALAKTVADLTCGQDSTVRQQIIGNLDARNYGVRCRVSSRGRITCSRLCCPALAAKENRDRDRAEKPSEVFHLKSVLIDSRKAVLSDRVNPTRPLYTSVGSDALIATV